jgi:DEAD/DEAH box helicase domain-containing protein
MNDIQSLNYKPKENTTNPFFEEWANSPINIGNITHKHIKNIYNGDYQDFPTFLDSNLISSLNNYGISNLYSHQYEAINNINDGKNVVITTGPSSGKSLAFLLPILNDLYQCKNSNALLLFPTKALAYDQYSHIIDLLEITQRNSFGNKYLSKSISVYDGDTPKENRSSIRKNARVILSNPDMLHIGILPNHQLWENFLENLKYVILDEAHIYHGVFGSHVANVIRRLKRILSTFDCRPIFICTSATIGNPVSFLNTLVEENFFLISKDGSPHGKKSVIFYNPPIINEELGIRKSNQFETIQIVSEFIKHNIQTLVFQVSRKSVEKSLKFLKENENFKINTSAAYRSGYLAEDRRKLEEEFRSGKIKVLFSTNALELGVDIGGLQSVMISGYPGSIASTLQQIGRSGRKQTESIAIIVASQNPIDQYIIKRPEYLFLNTPEKALINPDNPNILLEHLKCTLLELSFLEGDNFGKLKWEDLQPYIKLLISEGFVRGNNQKYSISDPSKIKTTVSLRNISGNSMKIINNSNGKQSIIGEIDYASSLWMVHPQAIYLHLGEQYIVKELDFERNEVHLEEIESPYYTEPKLEKNFEIVDQRTSKTRNEFNVFFGKIKVTQKVVGFKEILWDTHQKISEAELEMPETLLITEAFWFSIPESVKNLLIDDNLWLNYKNDYGPGWKEYKALIKKRDKYMCHICGAQEINISHHIHHKKPLKLFNSLEEGNHPSNLITLCPKCHRLAEIQVRVRSGMAGLSFLLKTLSPVFVMCGPEDLDVIIDTKNDITGFENSLLIFDNIPFGLGLAFSLYENFEFILPEMLLHIKDCGCHQGCPSCVGPVSDDGYGGKQETIRLIELLLENING